jgi:amino acid transporter
MNHDPVKQAWQASVEIAGAPPLDEVRKGANKFYRYVKWRNRVEYAACVVVIAIFTYYIFWLPHILHKIGSALVVAAAIYTPWQLHRRASAVPPEMAGAMPIYAFLRSQFVRQRDALRGIFGWYILPFLPGVALVFLGHGADPEMNAAGPAPWVRWLAFAGIFSMIGFIWWLNQLGARRLQQRIDEIDALTGRTE